MLLKKMLKTIALNLVTLSMIASSTFSVFAVQENNETQEEQQIEQSTEDFSRFEKTQYENKYGKDGRIETLNMAGYAESYRLTNEFPLESNVVLYLITENYFEIDDSLFVYDFGGMMDITQRYCDMGFSFNFGLLENKKISTSPELKCGETVNVREYQFAINSGFYNFYNEGENGGWSSNGTSIVMRTLTPEFDLNNKEEYLLSKQSYVEVKPNETIRLYVLLGTKDWYDKATNDIIDWAVETEKSIWNAGVENNAETQENIEVTLAPEKVTELEEILSNKEVEVEIEEKTLPNFQESTQKNVETKKDNSYIMKYVVMILILFLLGFAGMKLYQKMKQQQY